MIIRSISVDPKANKYNTVFFKAAHLHSYMHKKEILTSDLCGCFFCGRTFLPTEIEDWIEENGTKKETAICPKCGVDAVLSSKFPISDPEFMEEMHAHWFND